MKSTLYRFAPFTAFLGAGTLATFDAAYFLAAVCGAGAFFAGKRLLDRDGNARRELRRRSKENTALLKDVARRDRVAAPQMERMVALQSSVLESWDIMPEEYRSLLDDDIFTILEEIEGTARLSRRRTALRGHLANTNRGEIVARINSLERDIRGLPEDSTIRQTFETTLAGRRSELENCGEMLDGISLINAQLESAESLLSNLRGDFLTLDTSLSSDMTGAGLARLRERVSLFKRSLYEVRHTLDEMPDPDLTEDGITRDIYRPQPTEELPTR
ncbi:MAG: hypothetical protein ACR2KW_01500 [Rubrobacter sp.]